VATVYPDLIPVAIARDLVAAAEAESAVLELGNLVPMPAGVMSVPVVSVAPQAAFVSPAMGGRKPQSMIEWTAERLG